MARKRTIRRSQLIAPWGVGQMVNFPNDESLMVCGLDAWEQVYNGARNGLDEFCIREERLEKRLGVTHFRIPPEFRTPGAGVKNPNLRVPCIRFPRWHYCTRCGSMEKLSLYGTPQKCKGPKYSDGMSCHELSEYKRSWLIPVRFITICDLGHIEDFPFMEWVHKDREHDTFCKLRLRAGRASSSLSGINIHCRCTQKRSLGGAFNAESLVKIKDCSGHRPWLGEVEGNAVECGMELKVIQKGASNVYFPEIRSSIYLPHWDNKADRKIIEILETYWDKLTSHRINGKLNQDAFRIVADMKNIDYDKFIRVAEEKLNGNTNNDGISNEDIADSEELYRQSEYEAILLGKGGPNQDFYVTNKAGSEYGENIEKYFKSVTLLHKLRETRSLVGFSRWLPEDGRSIPEKKRELYNGNIDWLPAYVVRGEGIFFEFNENLLANWLGRNDVIQRAKRLQHNHSQYRRNRGLEEEDINPKFILLHTVAHILINQLSFSCGYGSSALRERIYCDNEFPEYPMNGILIYTASGDSEGSLGGLVRQGLPGNLEQIILSALQSAKWCSSDPVCMESSGQGPDSCNLAACHSCGLLPETSCENANRVLDRAMVTGSLDNGEIGYFHEFVN